MKDRTKCILCGTVDLKTLRNSVRDAQDVSVVECSTCGHIQLAPVPPPRVVQEYFDADHEAKFVFQHDFDTSSQKYLTRMSIDVKEQIKRLSKYARKSDAILEFGSGYGIFAAKMREEGYDITGLEISQSRRDICRKVFGMEMLSHNFLLAEPKPDICDRFDVVCGFQVFQQISDPVNYAKTLRSLLRKAGLVYVEVQNYHDWLLSQSPDYAAHYFHKAQISHFHPHTLKAAFAQAGFSHIEISGVQRYSFANAYHWLKQKAPQIQSPDMESPPGIGWLEDMYREKLTSSYTSDTIVAVARP